MKRGRASKNDTKIPTIWPVWKKYRAFKLKRCQLPHWPEMWRHSVRKHQFSSMTNKTSSSMWSGSHGIKTDVYSSSRTEQTCKVRKVIRCYAIHKTPYVSKTALRSSSVTSIGSHHTKNLHQMLCLYPPASIWLTIPSVLSVLDIPAHAGMPIVCTNIRTDYVDATQTSKDIDRNASVWNAVR